MQSDYAYQKKEKRSSSADSLSDDEQRDHYKTKIIQKESKIMKKQDPQKLFSHHYYKPQSVNKQTINQEDYSQQIIEENFQQKIPLKQNRKLIKHEKIIEESSQNQQSLKQKLQNRIKYKKQTKRNVANRQNYQINQSQKEKRKEYFQQRQKENKIKQQLFVNTSKVEKRQLSEQQKKQKCQSQCKLAEMVIQKILSNNTGHLHEHSLRDEVLELIDKATDVCEDAKQSVSNLFIDGIVMDNNKAKLYSQGRIKQALTTINNTQQRIVFFPTYFVTSHTFQIIQSHIQKQSKNLLLTGQFGFSKTFSVILYAQLTNFIINYKANYPEDFKKLSQNKKYQKISKKHKIFYWSIHLDQSANNQFYFIQNNSKQIINKQKSKNENHKLQQYDLNKQILLKYKSLGIDTLLICDQINQLSSILRDNQHLSKYQKVSNIKRLQQYNQLSLQQKTYVNCISMKNQLRSYFHKILYLSSVDIQKQNLLRPLDLNQDNNHSSIQKKRINLTKKIYNNLNNELYELVDFFIFEFCYKVCLNNILINWKKNIKSKTIKKLRVKIVKYLQNANEQYYLNHLIIHEYFKKEYNHQKINIQSKKQLSQTLQNHIKQQFFKKISLEKAMQKLKTFLDKKVKSDYQKEIKFRLLVYIYKKVVQKQLSGQYNATQVQINVEKYIYKQLIDQNKISKEFFKLKLVNPNIIIINFQCSIKIILRLFRQLFINEKYQEDMKCFAKKVMEEFFMKFKNHELGNTFQVLLISSTLVSGSSLVINHKGLNKRYDFCNNTQFYSFRAIPLKKKVKKLAINSQKEQSEQTQSESEQQKKLGQFQEQSEEQSSEQQIQLEQKDINQISQNKKPYSIIEQLKQSIKFFIQQKYEYQNNYKDKNNRSKNNFQSINNQTIINNKNITSHQKKIMNISEENLTNANFSIIVLPKKKDNLNLSLSSPRERKCNSKIIDLIIISELRNTQKLQTMTIEILLVDATVPSDQSYLKNKINKFLETFKQLKKQFQQKIKIKLKLGNQQIQKQIKIQMKYMLFGIQNIQKISKKQIILTNFNKIGKDNHKDKYITQNMKCQIKDYKVLKSISIVNVKQIQLKVDLQAKSYLGQMWQALIQKFKNQSKQ